LRRIGPDLHGLGQAQLKPSPVQSFSSDFPALQQVGAIPFRVGADGEISVLLLTSRETKRWVIPKGWPMKGKKNWEAAALEACEEAGIVGKARKKAIGSFLYFKRRLAHFDLVRVEVFLLEYERRLEAFREKGQREARWFPPREAAEAVDEPGLAALLSGLDVRGLQKAPSGKA
jgi:8-oxo-dGTP pyrophosphatase MutT (NUDIX family)